MAPSMVSVIYGVAGEANDLGGVPQRFGGWRVAPAIHGIGKTLELPGEAAAIATARRRCRRSIAAAEREPCRPDHSQRTQPHIASGTEGVEPPATYSTCRIQGGAGTTKQWCRVNQDWNLAASTVTLSLPPPWSAAPTSADAASVADAAVPSKSSNLYRGAL